MISLFVQQPSKWVALLSLYFVQGLPHGFFGQAMPVLLREQGIDVRQIGLLSLVAAPWALKFLWAGWLDRWAPIKHDFRRSWIFLTNSLAACALIVMSFFPLSANENNHLVWIAIGLIFINTLIATQDIATDAMAVENLSGSERGIGNGIQVAGYRLGMIFAGGIMISIFSLLLWQGALWLMAILMLLGTFPLLLFKPVPHKLTENLNYRSALGFFKLPYIGSWLLLLVLYKWGDAFGTQMIRPHFVDLNFSLTQIGWLLGIVGFIAGMIGALIGGVCLSIRQNSTGELKYSRGSFLILCLILEAGALLLYAFLEYAPLTKITGMLSWAVLAITVEHIAGGMATAALFTVMMDQCRMTHTASDYAVQSCLILIAGMVASALSGYSVFYFGYSIHYMIASVACLLVIVIVRNVEKKHLLVTR